MPQRLAAIMALATFVVSLVTGGLRADNTFSTTVSRALLAMAGTFIIGLIVGTMAQKMLDENAQQARKKSEISEAKLEVDDR